MLPQTKQNKNRNQQLVESSFSCLNCLRLHFYAPHSCVLSFCSFELDEQQWHHQPRASSFRLAAHTPVDDCFRQNKTKKSSLFCASFHSGAPAGMTGSSKGKLQRFIVKLFFLAESPLNMLIVGWKAKTKNIKKVA